MYLADRMTRIQESVTLAIAAEAQAMKAQGLDIIALATGEPDFDTPQLIKQAAIRAMDQGKTKYTPVGGTRSLKDAIIKKFIRDNNVHYTHEEILVSVGGKHSFFNLCFALLNRDDEVIIPAPYWVSYPEIVSFVGAKPIIIPCDSEHSFKLSPKQLADSITNRTRMLIINSPSNPTGAVYSFEELKQLSEVLREHTHVMIASDDMYEHVLLGDTCFYNILNVAPDLRNRTILLNGVSKAFAMTGWRIGYAGGPSWVIKAMEHIQSQSTSNPNSIAQYAAEEALNGDQNSRQAMIDAFNQRHQAVLSWVEHIPGLSAQPAGGAFYLFIDARHAITSLYQRGLLPEADDLSFVRYLLHKHLVAVVPGSGFGAPGFFRISFATSMQLLEQAFERIKKALAV
jgi:aspartate aminotransferase